MWFDESLRQWMFQSGRHPRRPGAKHRLNLGLLIGKQRHHLDRPGRWLERNGDSQLAVRAKSGAGRRICLLTPMPLVCYPWLAAWRHREKGASSGSSPFCQTNASSSFCHAHHGPAEIVIALILAKTPSKPCDQSPPFTLVARRLDRPATSPPRHWAALAFSLSSTSPAP